MSGVVRRGVVGGRGVLGWAAAAWAGASSSSAAAAALSRPRGYAGGEVQVVLETKSYDELKATKGVTELENPVGKFLVRDAAKGGKEQFDRELNTWVPVKKFENAGTLEWHLASPPPFHSFDEPLVIKFTHEERD